MRTREYTKRLIEMVEAGELDRDTVINSCVNYMSEADVKEMMEDEGFVEVDDDESI